MSNSITQYTQHTPTVVGITGRKRSGKTTVAEALRNQLQGDGLNVRVMSFANPLRGALERLDPILAGGTTAGYQSLSALFILRGYDHETIKDSHWGESYRKYMQLLGTEVGRQLNENLWVDAMASDIDDDDESDVIIIPDVRFRNEACMVQNYNGIILRVWSAHTQASDDTHASEAELDDIKEDHLIRNDGTVEDLERAAKTWLGLYPGPIPSGSGMDEILAAVRSHKDLQQMSQRDRELIQLEVVALVKYFLQGGGL